MTALKDARQRQPVSPVLRIAPTGESADFEYAARGFSFGHPIK